MITAILYSPYTPFRKFLLSLCLPLMLCFNTLRELKSHASRLLSFQPSVGTKGIDASTFPPVNEFRRILNKIGNAGPRTTGSEAHNNLINWIENELQTIPGIQISCDEYEILRWQTPSLKDAAVLTVDGERVDIAGVVPFSKPTGSESKGGEIVYLPHGTAITEGNSKGKIILRDMPKRVLPYAGIIYLSHSTTVDMNADVLSGYDRAGHADELIMHDLITAGEVEAAGVIIMFDIVQKQIESYFEPHQGVHFRVPAIFVGADEADLLKRKAGKGTVAKIFVQAEVGTAMTKNLFAVLPGQTDEKIIFQSHTDGNTFVQENGPAALLTLAQYFAKQPLTSRKRSIEFAFNTAHLHISREGTLRHATQLDRNFSKGDVALIIPVEHLGTKELIPLARGGGKPGRELKFTGRGEMMVWCVGPMPLVRQAVQDAIVRRALDRVVVAPGVGPVVKDQVPSQKSMGGIGSYYHSALLPTTAIISGPWSLWAPYFGSAAVDVERLRAQTMAVGDLYMAVAQLSIQQIAADYIDYRKRRANGAKTVVNWTRAEEA